MCIESLAIRETRLWPSVRYLEVILNAILNFAGVRCPEERGGRFSEVSFTLIAC